jgi:hypothetical protein
MADHGEGSLSAEDEEQFWAGKSPFFPSLAIFLRQLCVLLTLHLLL